MKTVSTKINIFINKIFNMKYLFFILFAIIFTACQGVDSGHKGVYVDWGGKTNMEKIYDEGMHFDPALWFGADLIEYDCREQTMTIEGQYLDYDGLDTDVEVTLYYKPISNSVDNLHKGIGKDYREDRMKPLFVAATRTEVAKHQALELNRTKRPEAETNLLLALKEDLSTMYVEATRVQILDVDLPDKISNMIEAAKEQDERNNLAAKLKLEAENKGAARVAKAEADYKAAQLDAKTKAILSQPAMLELKKLEIQQTWATKGISPYGNNNVFGSDVSVFRGLK